MTKEKLQKTLAQKHHIDIRTIKNTSLAGVSLTLSEHQADIEILFDLIEDLTERIEYLESHTHNYEDDNGTTTTTKTTQGIN